MKILYAAAEISPFAKMTSTADLLRFLPASLQDKGFEIRILLPKYGTISDRRNRLHEVIRLSGIEVKVGETVENMRIKVASIPNAKLQVYFLDNDNLFKRKAMFTDKNGKFMKDNEERITLYTKGIIATINKLGWKPDIIHCHDWAAGLVPFICKTLFKDEEILEDTKIIYNLHTPEHLGFYKSKIFGLLGLNGFIDDEIMTNGKVDAVKAGVKYSDIVVTGNYVNDEYNEVFEQFGVKPHQVQGAPADVSQKFSDFYREIADEI